MALVSPGVQVTIIDQSQYLPSASSSVPFVLVATAQNKANAAGTGVAAATTASNANKLYLVTSQRDLVNLYGTPFFYKTSNGTAIQGYELNEYGLLAAYSLLGTTNRCYVLRADIDLASLVGTLSRPVGDPDDGQYWLETSLLGQNWGINVFNSATGKFDPITPLVLTDANQLVGGFPAPSVGAVGGYAVIPTYVGQKNFARSTYFFKKYDNTWVELGSMDWKMSIPTVQGTISGPSLTSGDSFTISAGTATRTIIVSQGDTVFDIANSINSLGIGYLTSRVESGKLIISYGQPSVNTFITLANGSGTPLQTMGIAPGTYYAPDVVYASSANMPLWTSSQVTPHPTGSVWIKTSVVGNGMTLPLYRYSATTDAWITIPVGRYSSPINAIADLDSTGGKLIPEGTVFAQVGSSTYAPAPYLGMQFYKRMTTGPVIKEGTVTDFENNPITVGSTLLVAVTIPGTTSVGTYSFTTTGSTAQDFVTDWLSANIPNTYAAVSSSGAIILSNNAGGDIYLDDAPDGISSGLIAEIGFTPELNSSVSYGAISEFTYTNVTQSSTTGGGDGASFTVNDKGTYYIVTLNAGGGTGYSVGDLITIDGADIGGDSGTNDLVVSVQSINGSGGVTSAAYYSGAPKELYSVMLSNWELFDYIANEGAPAKNPVNGTNWFYSTATEVDIMVNKNGQWHGYRNVNYDNTGSPANSGQNTTDPNGVIFSTTAPTTQSNQSPLSYGDLWLDTSPAGLENYPTLSRWQQVNGQDTWVAIDNTDQVSGDGIVFADARWGSSGNVDPVSDPIPSITGLLTSDYVDLDCVNPALYPQGMLLFNTRRSGYNVKQFRTNYFTSQAYPSGPLPTYSYTWVSVSGLQTNGAAYMGRKAQRNMVVQAMRSAIGTNLTIREEDTFFNLIAAPNYPELQPAMVSLNNERNNTAYIIGDTPLRLPDQATAITNWANNTAEAASTGEDGLVTRDEYMGLFYPSGITTDLSGAAVVVPASHMMLRTFLRNDTIAYPWLAPAGTRRGLIDNATNIGYLDATTGEFVVTKNRMAIRDVLYVNQINPLAFFTGVGLLNYGNKNSRNTLSALDRINVARLVCYIRERLQVVARPFVFEPNDALTRSQIQGVVQSLFVDLVAKRGLYDYLVVCDESNNTPARIDRNELWIDVAIEPVKAAEFIYIPVRVLTTGQANS
jgi:hypothetical protein